MCPFRSWHEEGRDLIGKNFLYYKVYFHPFGSFIFLDRNPLCLHISVSLQCKFPCSSVFTYLQLFSHHLPAPDKKCFQVITPIFVPTFNFSPAQYLLSIQYHTWLWLSHLTWHGVSSCICWFWSSSPYQTPWISLYHFFPLVLSISNLLLIAKRKKIIPRSSVIMIASTITGNNVLIIRTIKMKSFILCMSTSSSIHTSVV